MRSCPICNYKNNKQLYTQKFSNNINHKIVCCNDCGFVFVSNTLNKNYYNKYYKQESKYEDTRDYKLHHKYYRIINTYFKSKNIKNSFKILDVGCATGHLLSIFKKNGYAKLLGIEPSINCKKIAYKKFNIKINTSDILSFNPENKYNLVILAAILEHLPDLNKSLDKITNFLSDDGYLFISIPDALNFYEDFQEPYGEFSIEHINFFSAKYLFLLLKDYSCCYLENDKNIIYSIWKRGNNLEKSVMKYTSLSSNKLSKVRYAINRLPNKIIVWGAGSLTQRLFQTTELNSKVYKLVDSSKNLIGKQINGIEVMSPNELYKYPEPILISSFRFKDEIIQQIKFLKLKNKILTF